jgi:hypothetical protein
MGKSNKVCPHCSTRDCFASVAELNAEAYGSHTYKMKCNLKSLNLFEKLIFAGIGWHAGCMRQPRVIRVLLYPLGLLAIPVGWALLPHWLIWPSGVKLPEMFLSPNAPDNRGA